MTKLSMLTNFEEIFEDVTKSFIKIDTDQYLEKGTYPVIDQGEKPIAGFTDLDLSKYDVKPPFIVFGDHTRRFKYIDFDCCLGADGAKVLKPKIDADVKFLFYALKNTQLENNGYSRHYKFLKRKSIYLPPLAEQQRIADILDKAEEIKRKRKLVIEKLGSLAEAMFSEMFGDPLANVKNWQQKNLGEVLNLITYGLTVRPNYVDVGIPLISAREIRNGSVDIQNGPKISRSDYDNLSDKSKPNFGDILFSKTGSIGHCALVETKSLFAVTQNAARLSFDKSTVNPVFALNYLRFGSIQRLAQRSARGNAVKDLQLGVMKQFPFPLPPLSLQDQFAKRIAKLDQLKADSISALIKQKQLCLTLQHQAFSNQL